MLKSEFESLIGKEVDNNTFAMYENMYMSLPNNVDKTKFVSMLNIEAIPESEDTIRRRKEKEQIIKNEIANKKADMKYLQVENERYRIMLKDANCFEMIKNISKWIESNNKQIANIYDRIRELEWEMEQQ